MPELIRLQKAFAPVADRFQIVAIHNPDVETWARYDQVTRRLEQRFWDGKPLPFPVLLDGKGGTQVEWDVSMFPTDILVDPKGHAVERGDAEKLEAILRPLMPAAAGHK